MKKLFLICALLALGALVLTAADFEMIDDMYFRDQIPEAQAALESALGSASSDEEKAGILWRLSRNAVSIGDLLPEEDKKGRFAAYERGEAYADQAIALKPVAEAYLWKCSNIGRWGQTKGPMNSLSKASPMRDILWIIINELHYMDSSEAWYVLGSLYDQLPGGLISFGNSEMAVSYMRLAVETIPSRVWFGGTYQYLAEMLLKRDWDVKKRTSSFAKMKKKFDSEKSNECRKMGYYEGSLGVSHKPFYSNMTLGEMTDRQEAAAVLEYALDVYAKRPFHTASDEKNFAEVKALLASIE